MFFIIFDDRSLRLTTKIDWNFQYKKKYFHNFDLYYQISCDILSNNSSLFRILYHLGSRHESGHPNPINSMSWINTKYCPEECFLRKWTSSWDLLFRMFSRKSSNLTCPWRNRLPWTVMLIKDEIINIDTVVDSILFLLTTRFLVLKKWFEIQWVSS